MDYNKLYVYEGIDIRKPSISTRSVLYPLEPIGIGTAYVESFTSYINRLALKHSLYIKDLFANIIIRKYNEKDYINSLNIQSLFNSPSTINGTTNISNKLVEIFMDLTTRRDLNQMTVLSFSNLFSLDLINRNKSYCPKCYEYYRSSEFEVYDPLIWFFKVINICSIHHVYLEKKCPYQDCRRELPYLKRFSVPGYCPYCNKWLGFSSYNLHYPQ